MSKIFSFDNEQTTDNNVENIENLINDFMQETAIEIDKIRLEKALQRALILQKEKIEPRLDKFKNNKRKHFIKFTREELIATYNALGSYRKELEMMLDIIKRRINNGK